MILSCALLLEPPIYGKQRIVSKHEHSSDKRLVSATVWHRCGRSHSLDKAADK